MRTILCCAHFLYPMEIVMSKKPANAPRNFVAVHAHEFNKAQVHQDRKKKQKDGYQKHKKANTGDW